MDIQLGEHIIKAYIRHDGNLTVEESETTYSINTYNGDVHYFKHRRHKPKDIISKEEAKSKEKFKDFAKEGYESEIKRLLYAFPRFAAYVFGLKSASTLSDEKVDPFKIPGWKSKSVTYGGTASFLTTIGAWLGPLFDVTSETEVGKALSRVFVAIGVIDVVIKLFSLDTIHWPHNYGNATYHLDSWSK